MKGPFRLAVGGRIDRSRPLRLSFDGRPIEGFAGDTVASALLANGVRLVGRSFKYHRPRGVLSHGAEEPNALVTVRRGAGLSEPNHRATVLEATDGLGVSSQNRWPSLAFDLAAINDRFAPFLAAGFYYKTFMWPRAFWRRIYEPAIRRLAGLGAAPAEPDPDRYLQRFTHCDLLVVGAGPAGLSAALAASKSDQRVMVVDEQAELGGGLLHDVTSIIEGRPAQAWLGDALATLRIRDNVTLLARTTAWGLAGQNLVSLAERLTDHLAAPSAGSPRERLWRVRAGRVVIAAGAHERPCLFDGNDRPGVMLAESVRAYINRYGVAPGQRLVFATAHDSAYRAAADAAAAGLDVTVVDERLEGAATADLRREGVKVLTGRRVVVAMGRKAVSAAVTEPVEGGKGVVLPCDCLAMSGGWTPAVHLFSQAGGRLAYRTALGAFVPAETRAGVRVAGAANGVFDLAECLAEGAAAGAGEAAAALAPVTTVEEDRAPSAFAGAPSHAFVDLQNDVTAGDIALAAREGFESVEHLKRYTTTGMATDQGKTSNATAVALLAAASGRPAGQIGVTTYRPPYTPVTFGTMAGGARGGLFDPLRKAPMDSWANAHGAVFEPVGQWRRARYFPQPGETMHAAVGRECLAVRRAVGLLDASTLGKIEVVGPDAAEFLSQIYSMPMARLEVGRCRYGVMLREDGHVFDDGVVARLAEDRFHLTTTTGGAVAVLGHMEDYLQTEWPTLRVYLTSITEQWATIAVQGPKARALIAPFVEGVDLAPEAFAHMSIRGGRVCGAPMRLFRVSFTGELGFEINVRADDGPRVWEALLGAGREIGAEPYGTEAMHVLRAEKGFIMVGQETDGTVTPADLGLPVAKGKRDFIGKRSLTRPALARPGRRQLVGLLTDAPALVLDHGAHAVLKPAARPMPALGHVTSSYWSATCGRSIAMALLRDGRSLIGRTVSVTDDKERFVAAVVTEPVFYDPEGERTHA
jgi:sarcosine oxidase subunit alpha